ncbi:hypothetical protein SAMN04489858_12043 [Paracoccus homiensis]|uniref:Uncharacterized protein n=1 Tax=Paracoccus homiensis TaxID=364199 RepID=A0A1I0J1R3_9RHOB|nr:hypothetical protein SAMN04489858_12043 [Paracoccus homiensis]
MSLVRRAAHAVIVMVLAWFTYHAVALAFGVTSSVPAIVEFILIALLMSIIDRDR